MRKRFYGLGTYIPCKKLPDRTGTRIFIYGELSFLHKAFLQEGIGYQPAHKRTKVTDALYGIFVFYTDYEVLKKTKARSTIHQAKLRKSYITQYRHADKNAGNSLIIGISGISHLIKLSKSGLLLILDRHCRHGLLYTAEVLSRIIIRLFVRIADATWFVGLADQLCCRCIFNNQLILFTHFPTASQLGRWKAPVLSFTMKVVSD